MNYLSSQFRIKTKNPFKIHLEGFAMSPRQGSNLGPAD